LDWFSGILELIGGHALPARAPKSKKTAIEKLGILKTKKGPKEGPLQEDARWKRRARLWTQSFPFTPHSYPFEIAPKLSGSVSAQNGRALLAEGHLREVVSAVIHGRWGDPRLQCL
jgi:hypothetical protein